MRYITLAIHTYNHAIALRALLENEGINVELNNVNIEVPGFSSGVRVRIPEKDLPLALRIVENKELFQTPTSESTSENIHSILIPVDFSERSFQAVIIGSHFAYSMNARLHLLYSYLDPYIAGNVQFTNSHTYEIGETGARKQMKSMAEQLMDNFCERVRSAMKSGIIQPSGISTKVLEGVPEDSIVDYAKTLKPSLIIMGTRSAQKKSTEKIGSVTAEVLDEGRFTVISIPEDISTDKVLSPKEILFFANLDQDDILGMDALYRLFPKEKRNITIVPIHNRRRFSQLISVESSLQRFLDYCTENFKEFSFKTISQKATSSEEAATNILKESQIDLIAIPNRRRSSFNRLFNPGVTQKILFNTDTPMLVIPV